VAPEPGRYLFPALRNFDGLTNSFSIRPAAVPRFTEGERRNGLSLALAVPPIDPDQRCSGRLALDLRGRYSTSVP
jgi:hypothetical protein